MAHSAGLIPSLQFQMRHFLAEHKPRVTEEKVPLALLFPSNVNSGMSPSPNMDKCWFFSHGMEVVLELAIKSKNTESVGELILPLTTGTLEEAKLIKHKLQSSHSV